MKDEGKDILNPPFSVTTTTDTSTPEPATPAKEVCMTKPGVSRKITAEELKAQDPEKPWVRLYLVLILASFDDAYSSLLSREKSTTGLTT